MDQQEITDLMHKLDESKKLLDDNIATSSMYLKDSLQNIRTYIDSEPFDPNFKHSLKMISDMDVRRDLDSRKAFPELYD